MGSRRPPHKQAGVGGCARGVRGAGAAGGEPCSPRSGGLGAAAPERGAAGLGAGGEACWEQGPSWPVAAVRGARRRTRKL